MNKMFEAIYGSVGNLLAKESSEKAYLNFKRIWFVNFYMIGTFSITFIVAINSFIELWLGKTYLLPMSLVFIICFNMYMRYIRNTCLTYIDTYGLFTKFRAKCVAEAVINMVMSLVYLEVFDMGIAGVLIGTFTSNIFTNFWYEPYVLYKYKFKEPLRKYMVQFAKYLAGTMVTGLIIMVFCDKILNEMLMIKGMADLILRMITCVIAIPLLYKIIFGRMEEYVFIKDILKKRE